jgi:hypothetical protein
MVELGVSAIAGNLKINESGPGAQLSLTAPTQRDSRGRTRSRSIQPIRVQRNCISLSDTLPLELGSPSSMVM